DLERRVTDGLKTLRDTLAASISVFVPPHNALSKHGIAAVASAGLNILGSFLSFRPSMRPWDRRTPGNWWRVRRFRESLGRSRRDRLVYPHVLHYTTHGEFGRHNLVPGTPPGELVAGFDEARRGGGDFCLATHYWEVDEALKGVLLRFLDHAGAHADVHFVAVEDLFTS